MSSKFFLLLNAACILVLSQASQAPADVIGNTHLQDALMAEWKADCTGFKAWRNRNQTVYQKQCHQLKARLDTLAENQKRNQTSSEVPCPQVDQPKKAGLKNLAKQATGALKSIEGYTTTSILEMVQCIQKQTPEWKALCTNKCMNDPEQCASSDFNSLLESKCSIMNSLTFAVSPIQVRAGKDCDDLLIALPDSEIGSGADKTYHRVYQLNSWKDHALGLARCSPERKEAESIQAFNERCQERLEAERETKAPDRKREAKNIRQLMDRGLWGALKARFTGRPNGVISTLYADENKILQERFTHGNLKNWIQKNTKEGPNLAEEISALKARKNQELLRLKFGADTSEGLEFIHSKKLVHGDVKPDNILIDPGNPLYDRTRAIHPRKSVPNGRAVLTDLGSSFDHQDCVEQRGPVAGGTFGYRAPSQKRGAFEKAGWSPIYGKNDVSLVPMSVQCDEAVAIGQKNDVYAHALIIYGLRYGHEPFWITHQDPKCASPGKGTDYHVTPECLNRLREELVTHKKDRKVDELDLLIERSLDDNPYKRPTAAEFRRAYDQFYKKEVVRTKQAIRRAEQKAKALRRQEILNAKANR